MAIAENKLIIRKMPWHANMTEKNHLGAAMIIKPEVFESKANQIFSAYTYSDNPLTGMLMKTGATRTIGSSEWEWELRGMSTRPLVVIENLESSNTTPGKYNQEFKIKLDEDWYLAGDIIHPGNPDAQVRIQEVIGRQGNGCVYSVRLMSDNRNDFLNPKYLKPGTRWAKLYSQYGEAEEQSGSTQYSLPMVLRSRMSRFRKMYKVTNDAANQVLAIKIPDSNGRFHDTWIGYAEVEYWKQWYRELERGAWYSKSTNTVNSASGRPIYSGPGVQELLKDSNIYYYNQLNAKLIEEYIMDIFYGKTKPGSGRQIKAYTGEYGMLQFHRAIQSFVDNSGFIKTVDVLTKPVASEYTNVGQQAGLQYVKYNMANGSSLELVHNPLYDDVQINFEKDEVTGYPIESMRYTFLDVTDGGLGANNIQLVDRTNGFALGYVSGMQTPYGPNTKGLMAHSGGYYEMHVEKQQGVHIEDVTKCGELILKRI